jgi:glutaredoxin
MSRLVVYVRSLPCPDMLEWARWIRQHPVTHEVRDITFDPEAQRELRALVGFESVPTLVITEDGRFVPVGPPEPLAGRRTRATDRGTVISEPRLEQIAPFLLRHGIEVPGLDAGAPAPGPRTEVLSAREMARPPGHEVTVYPIAGRQLFFRVPDSFCRECDSTLSLVERVAADFGDVRVIVKPWLNHLFDALWRGGWHAPVVTIDGRVFSQGVVPDEAAFRGELAALSRPVAIEPRRGAGAR